MTSASPTRPAPLGLLRAGTGRPVTDVERARAPCAASGPIPRPRPWSTTALAGTGRPHPRSRRRSGARDPSSRPELAPTPSTPDRCGLGRRPSARADTKNSGGTNPTRSSLVAGARQDPIWRPRPRAPGPPRRPMLTGTGRRREPASNAAQGGAAGRSSRQEGRQWLRRPRPDEPAASRSLSATPARCPRLRARHRRSSAAIRDRGLDGLDLPRPWRREIDSPAELCCASF